MVPVNTNTNTNTPTTTTTTTSNTDDNSDTISKKFRKIEINKTDTFKGLNQTELKKAIDLEGN